MKNLINILLGFLLVAPCWAGKQKIVVKLREPLRAESIKIRFPEITNNRGETRDLETKLDLGKDNNKVALKTEVISLKLDLALQNVGNSSVQVIVTLPDPGFVEIVIMDFYGKSLGTIFSGNLSAGIHPMQAYSVKDIDNNGIKFMTLRINGKMVLKKVMTKVR